MSKVLLVRASFCALFGFTACGEAEKERPGAAGPAPGQGGETDTSAPPPDDVPSAGNANGGEGGAIAADYPPGPYGENNPEVGTTIENLRFRGYPRIGAGVLVSTGEAQAITLAELRDEGSDYALIHTATMWCASCRAAADDLGERGDELSARGALIIELVLEAPNGSIPSSDALASWAAGSDLTVTTVGPDDERTPLVFPSREYAYVVELASMQVVWADQALFSSPTIAELGMEALEDFLAR